MPEQREVGLEEELDKGKAALTEIFDGVRNFKTPIIVEWIVADMKYCLDKLQNQRSIDKIYKYIEHIIKLMNCKIIKNSEV